MKQKIRLLEKAANLAIVTLLSLIVFTACMHSNKHQTEKKDVATYVKQDSIKANTPESIDMNQQQLDEMKKQNEQLQQRSRFTTGGVAMILGIIALLVFLASSNKWRHTLEVKNRQLERERNVVVAQNKQLAIERDHSCKA